MAGSLQKHPHVFAEGDQLPELDGSLASTDLTTFTIEFTLDRPDGSTILKSTATSGVTFLAFSGGNSTFKITWLPTDLQAGYGQEAQLRFIDSSGKAQTVKNFLLDVKPKKVAVVAP